MKLTRKKPSIFALMLIISFASVSAVLFLPSLPEIGDYFGVTDNEVSLTVTLFLIGSAIGQLPYGPFSDRFGRKKAMYGGALLAILSALMCAFSGLIYSFPLLLVGRFFLAIGSSAGVKTAYTMITDTHEGKEAAHMLAWTLLSFCIIPAIAVAIGGFITEYISWIGNFIFLAIYGVFLIFLTATEPETIPKIKKNALDPEKVIKRFSETLKSKDLLICSAIIGACTSISALFGTESPFLAIDLIGLTPVTYGFLNFLPSVGGIIGGLTSTRLVHKMRGKSIVALGVLIMTFCSLVMVVCFFFSWINSITLFVPMLFLNIGMSVMQPSGTTIGVESTQNKSYSSAMLSFLNIGMSGLCVFLVNLLPEHPLVMPLSFLILSLFMLLLGPFLYEPKLHEIERK